MINKKIESLIFKYLNDTASTDELRILSDWVEENEEEFAEYIRVSALIKGSFELGNAKKGKDVLIEVVKRKSTKESYRRRTTLFFRYAALFVVIFGLMFLYKNSVSETGPSLRTISTSTDDNIKLKLSNGEVRVISAQSKDKILTQGGKVIGTQRGNIILYEDSQAPKKLDYNELTVPYGKMFELVLSDKTRVYLNAGSTLRYPVTFMEQGPREVFLTGEAYFSVTKDKKKPFIVNADQINIEVLGTEFNVSIYPEDMAINTVLVEGAVKVSRSGNTRPPLLLAPNQMAAYNKEKHIMSVSEVDTDMYTAWKDGILLFRGTPFSSIKKKLERHFNVSIENNYGFLDTQVYTASFYREEGIEQILKVFQEDTPFEYQIENNRIIISKPLLVN